MNAIVRPDPPHIALETGVLVLADMQQFSESENPRHEPQFLAALENCRVALATAREAGIPVAFVRRSYPWLTSSTPWLPGILPLRSDMIFERVRHSCYASHAFAQMASAAGGFALAGFFSESTGIATAIDACSHGERITFLSDASWSAPARGYTADEMHRAATIVSSGFCGVCTTDTWITAASWGSK